MSDWWPQGEPAAVTVTFDGGYSASVEHALQELAVREIPSSWFLVGDAIGGTLEGRAVADWATWRAADSKLVEVGNHSFSHPQVRRGVTELAERALTHPGALVRAARRGLLPAPSGTDDSGSSGPAPVGAAAALDDFARGRDLLHAGLGRSVPAFAYPNGRSTLRLRAGVRGLGHTSARTSRRGWNHPRRLRPWALNAQTWTAATEDAEATDWIDRARAGGSWLIEVFHLVDRPDGYPWTTSPEQFCRHLDALIESGAWLATQSEVVTHLAGTPRVGVGPWT